jgi:zinc transport system permease protein
MIQEFFSSWDLFHNTYVVGWVIGAMLALIGVIVVARDQIFIGAAVSQASTLGIAVAMASGTWFAQQPTWVESEMFLSAMAVAFSVLAALLTTRGGGAGRESHEAITGWVFLFAASMSILLVSHSPHGLEEIQRLLSSSIIGATTGDVWLFSTLAVISAAAIGCFHRRILLLIMDPSTAAATGMRTWWWETMLAAWTGIVIGLSIRSSGMLYTFGCLILPPLAAKNVSREVRPMFLLSPIFAIITGVVAFILANHFDFPPAQMCVAALAVVVACLWCVRGIMKLVT